MCIAIYSKLCATIINPLYMSHKMGQLRNTNTTMTFVSCERKLSS